MNWQPGTDRHFLYKNTKMKVELLEIFGNDDMVANAAHLQCNAAMLTEYYFTKTDFDNRKKYDK